MNSNVIMGFEFQDEVSYNQAKNELEKILKIKGKCNIKNSKSLLLLYNRLIDENIFNTPVGMAYLRSIQKELYGRKDIDKQSIRNIPATVSGETEKRSRDFSDSQTVGENAAGNGKDTSKNRKKIGKYRDLYIKMLIVNIILVVTIAVMFVITKKSEKFDLDYYRESIENEYINWENNLKERESSLAEQEKSE